MGGWEWVGGTGGKCGPSALKRMGNSSYVEVKSFLVVFPIVISCKGPFGQPQVFFVVKNWLFPLCVLQTRARWRVRVQSSPWPFGRWVLRGLVKVGWGIQRESFFFLPRFYLFFFSVFLLVPGCGSKHMYQNQTLGATLAGES